MIRQITIQPWQSKTAQAAIKKHNAEVLKIKGLRADAVRLKSEAFTANTGAEAVEIIGKGKASLFDAIRAEMALCMEYEVTTHPVLLEGWDAAFQKATETLETASNERKLAMEQAGIEIKRGSIASATRSGKEDAASAAIRELKASRYDTGNVIQLPEINTIFESLTEELQALISRM